MYSRVPVLRCTASFNSSLLEKIHCCIHAVLCQFQKQISSSALFIGNCATSGPPCSTRLLACSPEMIPEMVTTSGVSNLNFFRSVLTSMPHIHCPESSSEGREYQRLSNQCKMNLQTEDVRAMYPRLTKPVEALQLFKSDLQRLRWMNEKECVLLCHAQISF